MIRRIGVRSVRNGINCTARRTFFGQPETTSKVHHERRLIAYDTEQLYGVVANVENYKEFVPWCRDSTVLTNDGSHMDAELVVGFKYFKEQYISHVQLNRPSSVIATSHKTNLFELLKTEWQFTPASDPRKTWVTFRVEFKFKSQLYNNVSELFMKEVVNNMVKAFENRCKTLHGTSNGENKASSTNDKKMSAAAN